jgi:hypothetical protein
LDQRDYHFDEIVANATGDGTQKSTELLDSVGALSQEGDNVPVSEPPKTEDHARDAAVSV